MHSIAALCIIIMSYYNSSYHMGLPQPISDYTTQGSKGNASVHARVHWDLSSLGPTSCTVPDTNGKSNLDIKQNG